MYVMAMALLVSLVHRDQFVVWRHNDDAVKESYYFTGQGCILPMVRVAGTVTRRAVEATWLTASNAKVRW